MPVTQPGPSPASSADFQRILRALGRNWRFIALCAALTMGTFFLLLLGQPFVYRASTTLVAHNKQGLGDLSNLAATLAPGLLPPAQTGPNLMTELDVIQSRTVLGRVADELHLQVAVMDHARIETLGAVLARKLQALSRPVEETPDEDLQARRPPMTFADASVPAHRDEARWTLTRTGETTFEVVDDERNTALGQGTIGSPFSAADVSFTVAEIVGKVGDTYGLELKTRERAIDDLQEAVVARRPKDRSDVLLVEVSDQSPVVAKTLANAVANAYLAQTMDWKNDMAQSHDEFLREQIATAERNLADAQEALNTYRAQADTVSLSEETRGLIGVLTEAKLNLATQQMTVQQLQYAYDRLKKASPRDFLVLINGTMAEVPIQAGMVSELSGLITQREAFLTSRTVEHPEVQALDAQINAKKSAILGLVEQALNSARQRQSLLSGQVGELNAQRENIPETETRLSGLVGDVQLNQQLLTALKTRQQQNELAQASQETPIRVLDIAAAPTENVKPRPVFNLAVGLLAGLILGVSITLSKELLDTSIRRRDQAEDLGIPVVALIPRLQEHLRGGGPVVQRLFLAIRQDPASPVAESFRMLRAATSLATGGTQGRVLGITSPGVGEGKTLVTCNLATMYAQAGLRTLVIDCDLRRPAVARGFGLPASPGLSDVLEGRAELRDALRESGVAGLQLMTAGQRTPHASELLAGEGFQRLLATLRKDPEPGSLVRTPRFDVILLDLPPVAPVSETVVLGRLTSALYLLIRAGRTPHEVAADVLRRLEQAKVAVRGIVLNDVSKDDLGETARYLYYDYTDEGNNDDRRLWEKLTGQRRRRPSSSTATPVSPVEP